MFDDSRSFVTRAFLRAEFELDYRAYTAAADAELLKRLRDWDGRLRLSETQAEGAFTQTFFVETWGYAEAGRVAPGEQTLIPKLPISGEGAGGGPRNQPSAKSASPAPSPEMGSLGMSVCSPGATRPASP